ncbi:MAG: hypothetical protein LQ343_002373 [Gyalolechia ehrenbergii]|nr:MAG: hypothetical protein LQ343_002373 [Gyalolechia ehrenbergii]
MHFSPILLSALAAIPSLAAPGPASSLSMMAAAAPQWTIKSFLRTCNAANTSCTYSYSIDTHAGAATPCTYTVTGNPAARASYNNVQCGTFTISSNWSGQFGPDNGFQTLAVVQGRTIVYPAYTDKQLVNGQVVSPDQSYAPQNLP